MPPVLCYLYTDGIPVFCKKEEKKASLAGSRTPLSRVTGGCTSRYTTRDLLRGQQKLEQGVRLEYASPKSRFLVLLGDERLRGLPPRLLIRFQRL